MPQMLGHAVPQLTWICPPQAVPCVHVGAGGGAGFDPPVQAVGEEHVLPDEYAMQNLVVLVLHIIFVHAATAPLETLQRLHPSYHVVQSEGIPPVLGAGVGADGTEHVLDPNVFSSKSRSSTSTRPLDAPILAMSYCAAAAPVFPKAPRSGIRSSTLTLPSPRPVALLPAMSAAQGLVAGAGFRATHTPLAPIIPLVWHFAFAGHRR